MSKKTKKKATDEVIRVPTISGDFIELAIGTKCYVAYGENSYIIKLAEDLTDKDVILNIEYEDKISMPLERVVPLLLEGIPRYRTAYSHNYYNVRGNNFSAFSYNLIFGLANELTHGKEPLIGSLEELASIFTEDFPKSRKRLVIETVKSAITESVMQYNLEKIAGGFDVTRNSEEFINVSDEQMENWISGESLAPRDWRIFQALAGYDPSKVEDSQFRKKPDWKEIGNWKQENGNRFYLEYTVLVTYHRVFSRILRKHEDIIEIPDLKKSTSASESESTFSTGEEGYAKQISSLLRRIGIKREDKAVAVVYGTPTREKSDKGSGQIHKIKFTKELPKEDKYLSPSEIGKLVNEEQQLLLTLFSATHNYLVMKIMDEATRYYPGDEEVFKRYISLASWRFLSSILPGDNIIPVNLEYHELLNFGFKSDFNLIDRYTEYLHKAYLTSGLDKALQWSYEEARERVMKGKATVRDETELEFVTVYPTKYPTFNSAFEKMVELRPVIPQRFSELLYISKRMQLSKEIRKFNLTGLDDYRLKSEEFAELKKRQNNLSSGLAVYFGATNISIR